MSTGPLSHSTGPPAAMRARGGDQSLMKSTCESVSMVTASPRYRAEHEKVSVEMPRGNINTDCRRGESRCRASGLLDYKIDLESIRVVQFSEQEEMNDQGIKI